VFASKTVKGDAWLNNLEAPFTKNQNLSNPGPGKYGLKKKKDDLKKKILNEDVIKVPFGTGDVRSFNKKKPEDTQPGPGQYIDISKPQHSSVCKPLLKFS